MKLFQKLADATAKKELPRVRCTFQSDQITMATRLSFKHGYEFGFIKARDMACGALSECGSDPTGFGEDTIRLIGEEEVS